MSSEWVSYFGYGSLVNRSTRPNGEIAVNATLSGWQRSWEHRVAAGNFRQVACTSLSVEPAQGSIEGVVVSIRYDDLPALDDREYGYERIALAPGDFSLSEPINTSIIYIYRSLEENRHLANREHPIAQSYIDCVMAGYLERFGELGLQDFLRSTRGWEGPILSDRNNPVYPRSVNLSEKQHQHVDKMLASHRSQI